MKYTGERMMPEYNKSSRVYLDHISRYNYASQYVKDKIILDAASGSGYGTEILLKEGKAKKVYGLDISKEAVNYSRKKNKSKNIKFLQGDCTNIPLKDNSVDIVVSFETIEHLIDYSNFLKEIKRVLKNKGLLIISTPNPNVVEDDQFHMHEFKFNEFKSLINKYFKSSAFLSQISTIGSIITYDFKDPRKYDCKGFDERKRLEKADYFISFATDGKMPGFKDLSFMTNNQEIIRLKDELRILKDHNSSLISIKKHFEVIINSRGFKFLSFIKKMINLPRIIVIKLMIIFLMVFFVFFMFLYWTILLISILKGDKS